MDNAPLAEDRILDGRLTLRQQAAGHRVGTDAVLLAAMLDEPSGLVVDAGAGVGAVGLAVALRSPRATVRLVERDPALAEIAAQNVALNGVADRVGVAACDLLSLGSRRAAGLVNGGAQAVFTNPPFYAAAQVRASPHAGRAAAHVLGAGGLEAWLRACLALLAPDGRLAMIHLPEALPEIVAACAGRIGGLRVMPVHAREGEDARRILVSGRKGSRAPLALAPGLVLHDANGRFTACAQALHRGEALLPEA
ncbi:MAG: methyltransferase [Hyphomicrobiales bacterium]|nr:methyltransferase [Hyphomicrobiales bacterium]